MIARVIQAKECAAVLNSEETKHKTAMKTFTGAIGSRLSDIAAVLGHTDLQSMSKRRERMWTMYYEFRSSELKRLWTTVVTHLQLPLKYNDPWLVQVLSRHFLEKLILVKNPVSHPSSVVKPLTADEHQVLRYVAGYVLVSIRKEYSKNSALVEWINQQTDVDDSPRGSFIEFTKIWIEKVNRGGLFLVSDCVYELFHAMEQVLRQFLSRIPEKSHLDKEKAISAMIEDNKIQFYFSVLSCDIDTETSQRVLEDMIRLWITTRGNSYASAIVEQYKAIKGALKRKKALRKDLKQKSSE